MRCAAWCQRLPPVSSVIQPGVMGGEAHHQGTFEHTPVYSRNQDSIQTQTAFFFASSLIIATLSLTLSMASLAPSQHFLFPVLNTRCMDGLHIPPISRLQNLLSRNQKSQPFHPYPRYSLTPVPARWSIALTHSLASHCPGDTLGMRFAESANHI